jgi:glutamyl-Q tRNA(Asp) synthetase
MSFVTRFAPSPTGYLHIGHAFAAITAYEAAKKAGGRFLLRIEDTDHTRCRPDYEQAIYDDLAWLGLTWETPVRRQSDYYTDYDKILQELIDKGLVYRCFQTRKEIQAALASARNLTMGPDGPVYIGTPLPPAEEAAALEAGKPFAWRLSMTACKENLGGAWHNLMFTEEDTGPEGETGTIKATPDLFGDVVIARKETGTSYHLAGVHDEAVQGISHVIRGQDLFAATHIHVLIQRLLDLPTPIYRHHRLLTDENGKKFAKSDKSKTIRAWREEGKSPADLIALFEQY